MIPNSSDSGAACLFLRNRYMITDMNGVLTGYYRQSRQTPAPSIHRGQPNQTDLLGICDRWRRRRRKNLVLYHSWDELKLVSSFCTSTQRGGRYCLRAEIMGNRSWGKGPFKSSLRLLLPTRRKINYLQTNKIQKWVNWYGLQMNSGET